MTTPTHDYEIVEGTAPGAHVAHEPRTVKHVTNDDLYMMTEIGDGTFVQWDKCRKCSEQVGNCKCAGGPEAPDFMERWRAQRFSKELDARPDPSFELIPSLIPWLEERGYVVTKSLAKQLEEAEPVNDVSELAVEGLTDEDREAFDEALREGEAKPERPPLARPSTAFEERPPGNVYQVPEDDFPDF